MVTASLVTVNVCLEVLRCRAYIFSRYLRLSNIRENDYVQLNFLKFVKNFHAKLSTFTVSISVRHKLIRTTG